MPRLLVPLKVLTRRTYPRRSDGSTSVFPDLNALPPEVRGGLGYGVYLTSIGSDWICHNKTVNLGTGADHGEWVALVPRAFAQAAVSQFPSDCEVLTETELQTLYDNDYGAYQPDLVRDGAELEALKAERELLLARSRPTDAIDAEIDAALDPDNPRSGVRRGPVARTWAERKQRLDVEVDVLP